MLRPPKRSEGGGVPLSAGGLTKVGLSAKAIA
jgi:hypothetical protein